MTLAEAKSFYFLYHGHRFHMARDDSRRYQAFEKLAIDSATLRRWDEQLLEGEFENLISDEDHSWIHHGEILAILARQHGDVNGWIERLLTAMAGMDKLDKHNKVLIIENMAGRTESMKDGGVYFITQHSDLDEKMDRIMRQFMSFTVSETDDQNEPGWMNMKERYQRAVSHYQSAYENWKNRRTLI